MAIAVLRRRNPDLADMATTLTVLVLRGRRYVCAHVGDSRLYLFKKGNTAGAEAPVMGYEKHIASQIFAGSDQPVLDGLAWIDAESQRRYGRAFADPGL